MRARVKRGGPLGVAALVATAACSSGPPPAGPAETCTTFESESKNLVDADAGSVDGSSGIVSDRAPNCLPFTAAEVESASCSVFATLFAPGDESACGPMGLQTPDPGVLDQIRANQRREWLAAGGADSGPDPSTRPTCLVPRLPGTDAGGACSSSPEAGWCLTTAADGGPCTSEVVFSPGGSPNGALITIACAVCGD